MTKDNARAVRHYRPLIYLALLMPVGTTTAAPGSSVADLLGAETNIEAAKAEIVDTLEDAANDLLGKKAPFLKLNYLGNDDDSDSNGITVDYDWSREKTKSRAPDIDLSTLAPGDRKRFRFVSSALSVQVKGSYSHEDTANINNLSTAGLSLRMHVVDEGWLVKLDDPGQISDCIGELDPDEYDEEQAFNAAMAACTRDYFEITRSRDVHTWAYDAGLNYRIEANEDYTEHQNVYGLTTTLVFEPYRGSTLQKLNAFDYPFRFVTRPLWSDNADYNARLPSVHFALEQVDPTSHTARRALPGGSDRYDRWHLELAFASEVANIGQYPITFESSYRVWHENSAPAAVKAADLDEFRYSTVAFYFPAAIFGLGELSDFYLSYTHGRQPFDLDTGEAVAIGWKSNLKDLFANLLE